MNILARIALGVIGLAIGVASVFALREATLSTHEPVDGDSRSELVVRARTRHGEPGQHLAEMVEAVIAACRMEVASDLDGPIQALDDGYFQLGLVPELDQTNRRQFRGCVEDWTVHYVRVDVVRLQPAT